MLYKRTKFVQTKEEKEEARIKNARARTYNT